MAIRISTHNGSTAHREHNIRKGYVVSKQEHIDAQRSPQNEIWADEEHSKAYQRIFGQAVEKYNEKQKRADRKIKDYYRHICKDKKKHAVYEMIIQVGGKDDNIPIATHKAILQEFYKSFCTQNSNLECIGAYLHLDEATPHLHLDYIPVATGYKKGMEKQSALVKALEQMGYCKEGKQTAQIQWEKAMNMTLENICIKYGIEVEHPRLGTAHLNTDTYKVVQSSMDIFRKKLMKDINDLLNECSPSTRKEFITLWNERKQKNNNFSKMTVEQIAEEVKNTTKKNIHR